MRDAVFVSGGLGYIAGFLIRRLLDRGWTVHTSLRSLAGEARLRHLLDVDDSRLKVFYADLRTDVNWADAMSGCRWVAHLASPLPASVPADADELIVPARDGALRLLRAARAAGVQRFVMTSSVAAIAYGHGRGDRRFTEADWTNLGNPGLTAYVRSKTIAERAARDWVAAEGSGLEFCSINPSVVLGPVWSDDYSASLVLVRKLLDGSLFACPDIGFGVVDVRDLADLHERALTTPGLAGERFIASGRFIKLLEMARLLRRELRDQARRVSTRRLPDALVRFAARLHPVPRAIVGELGSVREFDPSHTRQVLGWATRPVEQSIVDAARSLIEQGFVRP